MHLDASGSVRGGTGPDFASFVLFELCFVSIQSESDAPKPHLVTYKSDIREHNSSTRDVEIHRADRSLFVAFFLFLQKLYEGSEREAKDKRRMLYIPSPGPPWP